MNIIIFFLVLIISIFQTQAMKPEPSARERAHAQKLKEIDQARYNATNYLDMLIRIKDLRESLQPYLLDHYAADLIFWAMEIQKCRPSEPLTVCLGKPTQVTMSTALNTVVASYRVDNTTEVRLLNLVTEEEKILARNHYIPHLQKTFEPMNQSILDAEQKKLLLQPPSVNNDLLAIFDLTNGNRLCTIQSNAAITNAEFNPKVNQLAVGCRDGTVALYDSCTGNLISTLLGHNQPVGPLKFNNDGTQLLSCARDSSFKWDTASGQRLEDFGTFVGDVVSAGFSHDSVYTMLHCADGKVRLWNGQAFKAEIGNKDNPVVSATFHPTRNCLIVMTQRPGYQSLANIGFYNLATLHRWASIDTNAFRISERSFSHNGDLLYTLVGLTSNTHLFDSKVEKIIYNRERHLNVLEQRELFNVLLYPEGNIRCTLESTASTPPTYSSPSDFVLKLQQLYDSEVLKTLQNKTSFYQLALLEEARKLWQARSRKKLDLKEKPVSLEALKTLPEEIKQDLIASIEKRLTIVYPPEKKQPELKRLKTE